jgi:hypothetical protein
VKRNNSVNDDPDLIKGWMKNRFFVSLWKDDRRDSCPESVFYFEPAIEDLSMRERNE